MTTSSPSPFDKPVEGDHLAGLTPLVLLRLRERLVARGLPESEATWGVGWLIRNRLEQGKKTDSVFEAMRQKLVDEGRTSL